MIVKKDFSIKTKISHNFIDIKTDIKTKDIISPILFIEEIVHFAYNFINNIVKYILLITVTLLQQFVNFKNEGKKKLMSKEINLYSRSFYIIVIFLLGLISFGWSLQVPFYNTIKAEQYLDSYNLEISPQDAFAQRGSLQTVISDSNKERIEVELYVVIPGDTLASVAKKFEISLDTLKWANNIKDVKSIKVGQVLKIPPGSGVLHTVARGETLQIIAKKYKGNRNDAQLQGLEQSIVDVNWLEPPYNEALSEGLVLFVPDGVITAPSAVATNKKYSFRSIRPTRTIDPDPNIGKFLIWPVEDHRGHVSRCLVNGHDGVDIADASMPNLIAGADGEVIYAGVFNNCTGYCKLVIIYHDNGYSSFYGHMNKIIVDVGQRVGQGQTIGQMGSTGKSTGPHVHFELRKGVGLSGTKVDITKAMQNFNIRQECGY